MFDVDGCSECVFRCVTEDVKTRELNFLRQLQTALNADLCKLRELCELVAHLSGLIFVTRFVPLDASNPHFLQENSRANCEWRQETKWVENCGDLFQESTLCDLACFRRLGRVEGELVQLCFSTGLPAS